MYVSIADQTIIFLQSILFGAGVGAYYDLLRALRRQGRLRGLLVALLDGVFWLASLVAFALFVLLLADGYSRSYVLIGLAGGLTLYFLTLSKPVLGLFCIVFLILERMAGVVLRLLAVPVGLLRRLPLKKIIHKIGGKNFKKTLPFLKE